MDLHTLAAWVAAISIIMAMIRLVGLWRLRRRLVARLGRSSGSCLGNKIYLHNLSARPLALTRWRIYVAEGLLQPQEVKEIGCFGDSAKEAIEAMGAMGAQGADSIVIEARCSHILFFSDEGLFNRSAHLRDGRRLYIDIETSDGRVSSCCLYPSNHPWPALQALLTALWSRQKRFARE